MDDGLALQRDICMSMHGAISLSAGALFFYAVMQMCKLWAQGSKLSSRKRVFLYISGSLLMRCIWYGVASFEVSLISGSGGYAIFRFFYYFPYAMIFRASGYLLENWFELYHKEKMRKKLPKLARRLSSQELSSLQIRKRSFAKRDALATMGLRLMRVVDVLSVVVWLFWTLFGSAGGTWISPKLVPSFEEAVLAGVSLGCLLAMCEVSFRRLANVVLARKSESRKMKRHNLLTMLLSGSVIIFYLIIILSYIFQTPSANPTSMHIFFRFAELIHCTFVLWLLNSRSLSLKAPFPSETKEITQDWLTHVLRENGHIANTTSVIAFWSKSLKGGCHFKVCRVSLRYSPPTAVDRNKLNTVVVKLLYWDKSLMEKLLLWVKFALNMGDREVMYLKSYRIEARFYKRQSNDAQHGLKIPEVYYNHEDCFNNRFGMVCQDLSALDDGQPNGFLRSDCEKFLSHLAEFHAANWGINPSKNDRSFAGWDQAGYWTGHKRESTKSKVRQDWEDTVLNFKELGLDFRFPELGKDLERLLEFIKVEFSRADTEHRTLCHGDFKISNLFIGDLAYANRTRAHRKRAKMTDSIGYRPSTSASEYESSDMYETESDSDAAGGNSSSSSSSSSARAGGFGSVMSLTQRRKNRAQRQREQELQQLRVLQQEPQEREVYVIDWQWFGLGCCAIDVAAFLCTTPQDEVLPNTEDLLHVYHKSLVQHLPKNQAYPWEIFLFHIQVAIADFCTYCITAKWSKMTPRDLQEYARKKKDGLHLRSFPHMEHIIAFTANSISQWKHKGLITQ